MKILLCLLVLSFSFESRAESRSVAEVRFNQNNIDHRYSLLFHKVKKQYVLKSVHNKKTYYTKLDPMQAQALQSYVNSIAWDGQVRRPSSNSKCSIYARLKSTTAKATICSEDYTNTGKTLGLLNELDRLTIKK